jgi:hypothetical protein
MHLQRSCNAIVEKLEPRRLLAVAVDLTFGGSQTVLGSPNVRASVDAATDQSEMSVSVNPTNPLNLVAFAHRIGASATMGTYYSLDGGATWTQKIIDNSVDGINGTFRFDPTLAFGEDGRLYIAYGVDPSGGARRLVVGRSLDGGATYQGFSTVATNSSLDKWILNTGRDPVNATQQNVYIAYRVTAGAVISVRLAASFDGGLTWPTDTLVPDNAQAGSDFSSFGMPAVGPNGELYVVWDDYDLQPANSQIKMATSLNAGTTFSADSLISLTPITRGNANGFPSNARYHISAQPDRGILAVPTIAADRSNGAFRGRLYAAYTTRGTGGGTDNTDVVVRRSTDNGATWSAPVTVHSTTNTASQFLPWLDVDRTSGAVAVAYYDTRNSVNNQLAEVWAAASVDGGVTFSESKLATAQSNQSQSNPQRYAGNYLEYIGLSAHDGTLHAVWADNRDAAADLEVYTARAALDSATNGNVLTVTADPSIDNLIVVRPFGATHLEIFVNGVKEFAGIRTTIDALVINGGNGIDDVLVEDLPAHISLTVNTGANADEIELDNSGTAARPVTVSAGAGDDVLKVNVAGGGASVAVVNSTDEFGAIEIGADGALNTVPGTATLLVTRSLSVANNGLLDLFDNDLVLDYAPGPSPLGAVEALIVSARTNGTWLGDGLTSTSARVNPSANTTLGAIESADYIAVHGAGAVFSGYVPDASAVLVKYTYYGDTDFNGFVDGDDYARTDSGFNVGLAGWFNGDFDLSTAVDGDDYSLIDLAFNTQGAVL